MSEIEFIKDVSTGDINDSPTSIHISLGEKIIVMQSGQIRPDEAFLSVLSRYNVIPMSGIPSKHAVGGASLREAANAGGISKIIVYWGNIETSVQPMGTKAVSWIPIAGYYIPDQSQKMRISISAIISDVASGRWTAFTAVSSETTVSHSMMTSNAKDSQQVEQLKSEAYRRLAEQITR
jgi:hypothetical protein